MAAPSLSEFSNNKKSCFARSIAPLSPSSLIQSRGGGLYAQFLFQRLQVLRIVIEELLRHARISKCNVSVGISKDVSAREDSRNFAASSRNACGTTEVPASTGIKFVSPVHLGTT